VEEEEEEEEEKDVDDAGGAELPKPTAYSQTDSI
jgi:hypothetical protein